MELGGSPRANLEPAGGIKHPSWPENGLRILVGEREARASVLSPMKPLKNMKCDKKYTQGFWMEKCTDKLLSQSQLFYFF